jgi:uncharacterized protein (TIGR02284 family)
LLFWRDLLLNLKEDEMAIEESSTDANDQVIAILNGLAAACKDGEEGFRTAAEAVSDPNLKTVFAKLARDRWQMGRELQDEVQGLGGSPETSGSIGGTVHRGWMNIKSIVTGTDDQKIIAEAERGEDVAKAAYESALQEPLPMQVRVLVERQAARVRAAHDQVRAMEKSGAR